MESPQASSAPFAGAATLSRAARKELIELQAEADALSATCPILDEKAMLSSLVGSLDMLNHPVHRWFYYKEGFSPALPPLLVDRLGVGNSGTVADIFCGVGTTPLSLTHCPEVGSAVGFDISPFAQMVARTKLDAAGLSSTRLKAAIHRLQTETDFSRNVDVPRLHTFEEPALFAPEPLRLMIRWRDAIALDGQLSAAERDFLLLGLAATLEENSGVMRDGRALRRRRSRRRRRVVLEPKSSPIHCKTATDVVLNQWLGMVEDLEELKPPRTKTRVGLCDARSFVRSEAVGVAADPSSIGLHVFSPPYLNFIDYTEVYKMELWFLGHVDSTESFRDARRQTLRSHPSIRWEPRPREALSPEVLSCAGIEHARRIASFVEENGRRPRDGSVIWEYFLDMAEVLSQVHESLEPGGKFACVVGNSTFSRRDIDSGGSREEAWSLPVQTDLILANMAQAMGFEAATIWQARELRPRNKRAGSARESVLVAMKPKDIA